MYFDIVDARHIGGYNLRLELEDGSIGDTDLSDYLKENTVFQSFQDIECFKNFRIEYGTIIWGKGEVDIAPETLYSRATGRSVTYSALKNQKA